MCELRRITGISQQRLATELNIGMRSLQLYELFGHVPEIRTLYEFLAFLDRHFPERTDLFEVFALALKRQIAPPVGYLSTIRFERDTDWNTRPRIPFTWSTSDSPPLVTPPRGRVIFQSGSMILAAEPLPAPPEPEAPKPRTTRRKK